MHVCALLLCSCLTVVIVFCILCTLDSQQPSSWRHTAWTFPGRFFANDHRPPPPPPLGYQFTNNTDGNESPRDDGQRRRDGRHGGHGPRAERLAVLAGGRRRSHGHGAWTATAT